MLVPGAGLGRLAWDVASLGQLRPPSDGPERHSFSPSMVDAGLADHS